MTRTGSRTKWIVLALILAVLTAAVALSLSLRANATNDVTIVNVYVGDPDQAVSFAADHTEETGYAGEDMSTPGDVSDPHHFIVDSSIDDGPVGSAMKALTASSGDYCFLQKTITDESLTLETLRVNVWILQDCWATRIHSYTDATTATATSSAIFDDKDAALRLADAEGVKRDVMVYLTGVTGYGADEQPVISTTTWDKPNADGTGKLLNYGYLNKAMTWSGVTINHDEGDTSKYQVFLQAHELVVENGAEFTVQGETLWRLVLSPYNSGSSSENETCNGKGEIGNTNYSAFPKEDGFFAGKVTLKSGTWDQIVCAHGHPGYRRSAKIDGKYKYEVTATPFRADYYVTVDEDAYVQNLAASSSDHTNASSISSFVGGPDCSVNYELKGGHVENFYGGVASKSAAATAWKANQNNAILTTVQSFDICVSTYDGVVIDNFKPAPLYVGDGTSMLWAEGDLTINLYGGTFNSDVYGICASDAAPKGNSGFLAFIGKLTLNIGDPETGSAPDIAGDVILTKYTTIGTNNAQATINGAKLTYVDGKYYYQPDAYVVVGEGVENPTRTVYAQSHAGVEFNLYGGSLNTLDIAVPAYYSSDSSYTLHGGTVDTFTSHVAYNPGGGSHASKGDLNFTMKNDATVGTMKGVLRVNDPGCVITETSTNDKLTYASTYTTVFRGNLNILMQDNAKINDFWGFISGRRQVVPASSNGGETYDTTKILSYGVYIGANTTGTGTYNVTIKDNAVIEKTLSPEDEPEGYTYSDARIHGIFMGGERFEGYDEIELTANYIYGEYNFTMDGGTVRLINNTPNTQAAIFFGGNNLRVYGDTEMTFKGGASVELARTTEETGEKASAGIYLGGNESRFFGDWTVDMEDCTFSTYKTLGFCVGGKKVNQFVNALHVTVGSEDGTAYPKFNNGGSILLTGSWLKAGGTSSNTTIPTAIADQDTVDLTVNNFTCSGETSKVYLGPGNSANSGEPHSWIGGNMNIAVHGGTYPAAVYTNNCGYVFGNVNCTIDGGTFTTADSVLYLKQCRGTATYDIDGTNLVNAKESGTVVFGNTGASNYDPATGKVDASIPGDMVINVTNLNADTFKVKPLCSSGMAGNLTVSFTDCDLTAGNYQSGGKDYKYQLIAMNTLTLTGYATATYENCSFTNCFGVNFNTTVTGNIKQTLKNCTVTGTFAGTYGDTDAATGAVNGNVENVVKDSTVATYIGGGRKMNIGGDLTNDLTNVTANVFVGGANSSTIGGAVINKLNNVSLATTSTMGHTGTYEASGIIGKGIVNEINGLGPVEDKADFTVYMGSQYGTVNAPTEGDYEGVAIHTTVEDMAWDGSFVAGGRACTVNGDIECTINGGYVGHLENGSVNYNRHLICGNLLSANTVNEGTTDEPNNVVYYADINGDVTVTINGGAFGNVYLGNRNYQSEMIGNDYAAIKGDVTLNVNGGEIANIHRGFKNGDNLYASNITGSAAANISTVTNDVTLKNGLPGNAYGVTTGGIDINVIAGSHTLYKASTTSTNTISTLTATAETPLIVAKPEGQDWDDTVQFVIPGVETGLVQFVDGPHSTLIEEAGDDTVTYTGSNWALKAPSRSLILDTKYSVRYVIDKGRLTEHYDDLSGLTVAYHVNSGEEVTLGLTDLAVVTIDETEYYSFIVSGIDIADFAASKINVTVTLGDQVATLNGDTVNKILSDLAKGGENEASLATAIRNYASAVAAVAKGTELPEVTKTVSDDWVTSTTAGETTNVTALATGIKANAMSITVNNGVTFNFYLKVMGDASVTAATVNNVDVIDTLAERQEGVCTVSFDCNAADLVNLLTLTVNGGTEEVNASPLTYAKALAATEGNANLGQAIIEYAYYVSTYCSFISE